MARAPRATIESVRSFNRFYTREIGVLQERLLRTPFSLAEARVIYEMGKRESVIAAELSRELVLDFGYLSRILRSLERRRLIRRSRAPSDGRQHILILTPLGRAAFKSLDARSRAATGKMLGTISAAGQHHLLDAMKVIQRVLGKEDAPPAAGRIKLRPHRPGDMGWVVERHGTLYANQYGWDERFEGIVAGIVADFIRNLDAKRERCWIAELDGRRVGCVFLVRKNETTARLRLLLVEPEARGSGLGTRLVDECLVFARGASFKTVTLWTNNVLHRARWIYERAGFELVDEERHALFGRGLIGQTWELKL